MYTKLAFAALAGVHLAAAAIAFGPNGPEHHNHLVIPDNAGPWAEGHWAPWGPANAEHNAVEGDHGKQGKFHHHHPHPHPHPDSHNHNHKHHHNHGKNRHHKADHRKDHAASHLDEHKEDDGHKKGTHRKYHKHHRDKHYHHKHHHHKQQHHHKHHHHHHKHHHEHNHHRHHDHKAHQYPASGHGRLVSHPHGSSEHRHAGHAHSSPASEYKVNKYAQMVVKHHNVHRVNHSAPAIQWDHDLASTARKIAASCVYAHNTWTDGGGYGQNIAAGTTTDQISVVISDLFYNGEVNWFTGYGQANPDMSNFEHWGHFSQVVWNDTTHVGCATQFCSGGLANTGYNVQPYFTVCNYKGPGNFGGEYGANIGQPLGQATVHGVNHL